MTSLGYRRFPLGFIPAAISTISIKPTRSRCAPTAIALQMAANRSKSSLLPDSSGYASKCGITRSIMSSSRRVSHFKVLSLRSGRMLPHPKCSCSTCRTSARSPFWLTEKLGLTSHPTSSVARGAIETVKHPSPSAYPEMYAERNSRLRQGPASDRTLRLSPAWRTARVRSHVQKGRSVVTGSSTNCADFPRDYPLARTTSLSIAYEEGFPVISRLPVS
jgi:hypothetical protein